MRTIGQTFRPEFINRLDKIIVFQPLSRELMRGILHKELERVLERRGLKERNWAVEWEASAIEFLLDRGFSPEMGARPLKRAIDQHLLAPLAATMVEHRFPEGDQFLFVRSNGKAIEVEFVDPDAEPAQSAAIEADADADAEGGPSLARIMVRQSGTAPEGAALAAHWREISGEMASESWNAAGERLSAALADPAIWSRDDRHKILSRLETMDRLREAARTAERLLQRYGAASRAPGRASRELASRIALQLHNLRQGLDDLKVDAPIDALLRVEPAMDAGGESGTLPDWCARLTEMYRLWAAKRHMRLDELAPGDGKGPILHVTGFGAQRVLEAEAGLHVLEDPAERNARRLVARVVVASGPEREPAKGKELEVAASLLAAAPGGSNIVRRYRAGASPVVRDTASGWRTGKLDAVLGGDFDLMGALARRRPAA